MYSTSNTHAAMACVPQQVETHQKSSSRGTAPFEPRVCGATEVSTNRTTTEVMCMFDHNKVSQCLSLPPSVPQMTAWATAASRAQQKTQPPQPSQISPRVLAMMACPEKEGAFRVPFFIRRDASFPHRSLLPPLAFRLFAIAVLSAVLCASCGAYHHQSTTPTTETRRRSPTAKGTAMDNTEEGLLHFPITTSSNYVHTNTDGGSAHHHHTFSLSSIINSIIPFAAAAPTTGKTVIKIGYLLMNAIDNAFVIAGYQPTIRWINENNIFPNIEFELAITHVPCLTLISCLFLSNEHQAIVDKWIEEIVNQTHYDVILRPNDLMGLVVVDAMREAQAKGGITKTTPVIDPVTFDPANYEPGSDFIVTFVPKLEFQLIHLFTFMQQDAGCADAGIVYGFDSKVPMVNALKAMFAAGGLPTPAVFHYLAADSPDEDLVNFFMSSPHRKCYITLIFPNELELIVTRLDKATNGAFSNLDRRYYGPAMMGDTEYKMFTDTDGVVPRTDAPAFVPFNVHFVQWFSPFNANEAVNKPSSVSAGVKRCLDAWKAMPGDVAALDLVPIFPGMTFDEVKDYVANELEPTNIMLMAHLTAMYTMRLVADAVRATPLGDDGLPAHPTTETILQAAQQDARSIHGFPLYATVMEDPPFPMPSIGYCNSVARTTYLMHYDGRVSTEVKLIADDPQKGQRAIASVAYPTECARALTSWSYPITGLMMTIAGMTNLPAMDAMFSVFGEMTRKFNYAEIAPARPFRYALLPLDPTILDDQEAVNAYAASFHPFVIFGSISSKSIAAPSALTLFPNLVFQTEEPPLNLSTWDPNLLMILPYLQDYIHALAAYYANRLRNDCTSLHVITSTRREAELVQLSLGTFNIWVPLEDMVITDNKQLWGSTIAGWLANTASAKPFVFAAANVAGAAGTSPALDVMVAAFNAFAAVDRGLMGAAVSDTYLYDMMAAVTLNTNNRLSDIIFASYGPEFWITDGSDDTFAHVPTALVPLIQKSGFMPAFVGFEMTQQLAQYAQINYKSKAADILYRIGSVTTAVNSFGPFSSEICSAKQIAENDRSRTCMCTKGPRRFYVHSAKDRFAGATSSRTSRYSYQMQGCGVIYVPYVHPPAMMMADNSLATGAIVGIAVGGVAFVVIIAVAMCCLIRLLLFSTRNNKYAPKDSSRPFAIVFTDIQSSTGLWSRAPSVMSEAIDQHHTIIRELIYAHGGYEVKTVGDSFMVAFEDANNATVFALNLQTNFFQATWSDEIDPTYIELIMEQNMEGDADDNTTTAGGNIGASRIPDGRSMEGGSSFISELPVEGGSCMLSGSNYPLANANSKLGTRSGLSVNKDPNGGDEDTVLSATVLSVSRADEPAGKEGAIIDSGALKRVFLSSHSVSSQKSPGVNNNNNTNFANSRLNTPQTNLLDANTDFRGDVSGNPTLWHGLRVRVGIHYGMGDIRKDPVSQGYDYYGTVVNTAARVEGVGHGGQTLVTDKAYAALDDDFVRKNKAVCIHLGPQPLRGLDEPITLYQMLPEALEGRKFPALRLHIEKETDDTDLNTSESASTVDAATPETLAARMCSSKQFKNVSPEDVVTQYHFFSAMFGPAKEKYTGQVVAKLGESWGFEGARAAQNHSNTRMRLLVNLLGKVLKTVMSTRKAGGLTRSRRGHRGSGTSSMHQTMDRSTVAAVIGRSTRNDTAVASTSQHTVTSTHPGQVGASTNNNFMMSAGSEIGMSVLAQNNNNDDMRSRSNDVFSQKSQHLKKSFNEKATPGS